MRILIVEDEHKIATALKKGLEQEMYSVDVAYDGLDGYDLAISEKYDAIILDLMLPSMDGNKVCEKLRAEKNHTPILMLTAKGELDDKVKGLNSGADDYLTKPFAFEELLARLKSILRRPSSMLEPELKCGNLALNSYTYEVKRGKSEINLSKKEFALLEYLLRNKGRILSKEQITANVWNFDADILPNTVEQYIGYLRNKIDKAFKKEKPLIYTVRGFGYKIAED